MMTKVYHNNLSKQEAKASIFHNTKNIHYCLVLDKSLSSLAISLKMGACTSGQKNKPQAKTEQPALQTISKMEFKSAVREEVKVGKEKADKKEEYQSKENLSKIGIFYSNPDKAEVAPLLPNNHRSQNKGDFKKSQLSNGANSRQKRSDQAQMKASWLHEDKVNEQIPVQPSPRSFHRIEELNDTRMEGSVVRKVHQAGVTPITEQSDIQIDEPNQIKRKKDSAQDVANEPEPVVSGFSWEDKVGKVSIID